MRILYYKQGDKFVPGIVTGKGIITIDNFSFAFGLKEHRDLPLTNEIVRQLKNSEQVLLDTYGLISEDDLVLGPCVPNPSKIICIGLNYRKHAIESGMDIPAVPIVFTKYNNTLTEHGSDITLGKEGEQFDYEVELGVVIGTKCKNVVKEDALNYVLG